MSQGEPDHIVAANLIRAWVAKSGDRDATCNPVGGPPPRNRCHYVVLWDESGRHVCHISAGGYAETAQEAIDEWGRRYPD